jgi:hypothetical protein
LRYNPLAGIESAYEKTKQYVYRSKLSREARIRYRLAHRELERWDEFDVPLRERWNCWNRGFLTRSSVIYPLESWDDRTFVTDVERERSNQINIWHGIATRNKLLFARQLRSLPDVYHPTVFAIVEAETVVPERWDCSESVSIFDILQREGAVVLKPIYGYRGQGIYVIQHLNPDGYILNGKETTENDLRALIASLSKYLVTEYVDQAAYLNSLYPEATNTLRLMTIRPSSADSPQIIAAAQRIGTDETSPTDNWSNNGIAAQIDRNTGELMSAVGLRDGERVMFDEHPDTNARITGRQVPNWESICERTVNAASVFPEFPYLAWDVVPRDEGPPAVIEANAFPDVDILQLREPLLEGETVKSFFEDHGVI